MLCLSLFFLRDASSTATYTLSLHDALPIYRGGPRALPQHRAERRDPLGGAGHGRAGRLGRRPLVARAHPALSVTEECHGFPGALRTLGVWGPFRGPHVQKAPCRPAPAAKRAAPSRLSPESIVTLPSSNSRRSAASSVTPSLS